MSSKTIEDSTGDRTVLTVRVATLDDAFDDLEERFEDLDAGNIPDPMQEVILSREADMNRLLSPKNVELLRTIAREEPESIRVTARLVDRDVKQVHANLEELEQLNLVRFETDGRAKRPIVWYDDLEVEVPITDDATTAPA